MEQQTQNPQTTIDRRAVLDWLFNQGLPAIPLQTPESHPKEHDKKAPAIPGWNKLTLEESKNVWATWPHAASGVAALSIITPRGQFGFLDFDDDCFLNDIDFWFSEFPVIRGQKGAKVLMFLEDTTIDEKKTFYSAANSNAKIEFLFGKNMRGAVWGEHPAGMRYEFIYGGIDKPIPSITNEKLGYKFGEFIKKYGLIEQKKAGAIPTEQDAELGEFSLRNIAAKWGIIIQPTGMALCPKHAETHPSLFFRQGAKMAHCFGCGANFSAESLDTFMRKKARKETAKKLVGDMTDKELSVQIAESPEISIDFANPFKTVERFIKQQPVYFDESQMWWWWDDVSACWKMIDETAILNGLDRALRPEDVPHTARGGTRSQLLEAFKRRGRTNKPDAAKESWVQFGRIIVDVLTGETFPASSKWFLHNPIPHELGESEATPIIDKLFEEWVGADKVAALTEAIVYTALADYPIASIFAFVGSGNNGKDQCLNFIHRFIGTDNVCASELDALSGSNNRFESARLYKKLLCIMGETNVGVLAKTSFIKRLTGRSLMPFEFKNKMPFSAYNYAKIFIASNALPPTTDKTPGFYRRWNIFEFKNNFEGRANPKILETIPKEEYGNFAKKAVRILKELIERGELKNAGTWEEKAKVFERLSNPVSAFIKEFYEKCGEDSSIELFQLHNEYCDYAKSTGKLILSKEYMKKILNRDGYYSDTQTVTYGDKTTRRVFIYGIRKKGEESPAGAVVAPSASPGPQTTLQLEPDWVKLPEPMEDVPCSFCKEFKPLPWKHKGNFVCSDCKGDDYGKTQNS